MYLSNDINNSSHFLSTSLSLLSQHNSTDKHSKSEQSPQIPLAYLPLTSHWPHQPLVQFTTSQTYPELDPPSWRGIHPRCPTIAAPRQQRCQTPWPPNESTGPDTCPPVYTRTSQDLLPGPRKPAHLLLRHRPPPDRRSNPRQYAPDRTVATVSDLGPPIKTPITAGPTTPVTLDTGPYLSIPIYILSHQTPHHIYSSSQTNQYPFSKQKNPQKTI